MFSHIVVYLILTVLSLTTAYAIGKPMSNSAQELHEPEAEAEDKDSDNSL